MSDLVICKTWIAVNPQEFYNPMIDLREWRRMKTLGEIRHEHGVPNPWNADSEYGKKAVRPTKRFNPLKIPKTLEGALPFATKPKNDQKRKPKSALKRAAAIVTSEEDKKVTHLLQRLRTVKNEKRAKKQETSKKKRALKEKREEFISARRIAHEKENRRKRVIKASNEEVRRRKALRLED